MPDLTTAVEIAAKAFHQTLETHAEIRGLPSIPSWEKSPATVKHLYRENVLPIVTALAEAGLLKEDTQ